MLFQYGRHGQQTGAPTKSEHLWCDAQEKYNFLLQEHRFDSKNLARGLHFYLKEPTLALLKSANGDLFHIR